jgi:phage shock protein E
VRTRLSALVLVIALGAAGCGAADAAGTAGTADAAGTASAATAEPSVVADAAPDPTGIAAQAEGRTLIDVRTPAEVAEGALVGAVNLDLQGPDFVGAVSELPRDEAYFVYCRSGNRSAQAIEIMRELGFTDLVDGGGFADLVTAGLPAA